MFFDFDDSDDDYSDFRSNRINRYSRPIITVGTNSYYCGNYYHYTDQWGAQGIMNSGHIRKSRYMAGFPEGVYFVTMAPESSSKDSILWNNYGSRKSSFPSRADWVVTVPASALVNSKVVMVSLGRRTFYSYPELVYVSPSQVTQNLRSF